MSAYYNTDAEVTFGMEDIEDQLNDLKLILLRWKLRGIKFSCLN